MLSEGSHILRDTGAASWDGRMFAVKVYYKIEKSPWALLLPPKNIISRSVWIACFWLARKKFLANQRRGAARWLWCFLTWRRFPHGSPLLRSTFNWESFSREVLAKKLLTWLQSSLHSCVLLLCVCVHPLNQDISQAIIGTLFSVPSSKDGRMGHFRGFSLLYVEV